MKKVVLISTLVGAGIALAAILASVTAHFMGYECCKRYIQTHGGYRDYE